MSRKSASIPYLDSASEPLRLPGQVAWSPGSKVRSSTHPWPMPKIKHSTRKEERRTKRQVTGRMNPTLWWGTFFVVACFSLLLSSLFCFSGSRSNRSLNTTCLSQDILSLFASKGGINSSWHVPSFCTFLSERIPPFLFYLFACPRSFHVFDCFVYNKKRQTFSTFTLHALLMFAWWCAFSRKFLFSFVSIFVCLVIYCVRSALCSNLYVLLSPNYTC